MSFPTVSTPLPLPTFYNTGSDATAADLLAFLQNVSNELEIQGPQTSKEYRDSCLNLIKGLSDHLLRDFPSPRDFPWTAVHEKTKLTEVTLELISRAAQRVDEVFCYEEKFTQVLFVQLLNILYLLDTWLDVSGIPVEDKYPSPAALRVKARDTAVTLLRCLGNLSKTETTQAAGWQMFRIVTSECLDTCNDLLSSVHTGGEIQLRLFSQPRLFATEDIQPPDSQAECSISITLHSESYFPLMATSLLEVLLHASHPALLFAPFASDVFHRLVVISQRCCQHLLSPACRTTDFRRARSMCRLAFSMTHALQSREDLAGIAEAVRFRILLDRMREGFGETWMDYDALLHETLAIPLPVTPSAVDIRSVAASLTLRPLDEGAASVRALCRTYLKSSVARCTSESLRDLQSVLVGDSEADIDELCAEVNIRLESLTAIAPAEAMIVDLTTPTASWREAVRDVTQAIVEPDRLAWMDDDESLSDTAFVSRALSEIDARFEKPLYNPSPQSRVALANELRRFSCALARHLDSPCPADPRKRIVNAIQPCLRVSTLILDGPDNEVTAPVRKAVYDALSRSINHQTSAYGGGRLEHAAEYAGRGMKDADRSVRLSAGRCMVELVKLYERLGGHCAQQSEPVFNSLENICKGSGDRYKETVIVTIGSIAKLTNADILCKAIQLLLSLIGNDNPVLRGSAYLQLCAMAKYHNKSHYTLFAPYMDRIAPYLVGRICSQPTALTEACRFLTIAPQDFLNVTLIHTLPHIFADRDKLCLDAIATATQKKCHTLFLAHESKILARAFMVSKLGQTSAVLKFVTAVLSEAAGDGTIDIASVLKSCLVNLISELVMHMGDEEGSVATQAEHAILKVEQLAATSSTGERSTPSGDTSVFLRPHMLGIITQLNDVLQDKQTVDVKRRVVRSLGAFMHTVGPAISNVAPQIMATLQSTLMVPELVEATLFAWDIFLRTMDVNDVGSYVGPTSASFVTFWSTFPLPARESARKCLEYVVFDIGDQLSRLLDDMADLSDIPDLRSISRRLTDMRRSWTPARKLNQLLIRLTNDNQTALARALMELRSFLQLEEAFVRDMASGDVFDPAAGQTLSALLNIASRDGGSAENLRSTAFECIGILGALDPDRLEFGEYEAKIVVINNFTDEMESVTFAVHLVKDVLVSAFRSTSDTQYQTQIAYAIQELLKFCNFTSTLVNAGSNASVPLKVRNRWNALPKQVIETITPLLESRYSLSLGPIQKMRHPIYPEHSTYREWISTWTSSLISQVSGAQAKVIFSVFSAVVHNRDVGVAHHLLPHLVLNILVSGAQTDADNIRVELLSVLQDQVDPSSQSTVDKRDLSAQTVFVLMDHLNKWVRLIRQELRAKRSDGRRARSLHMTNVEDQLVRVDSIMSSIDQNLMARAALRCKAYARALMSFERQVVVLRKIGSPPGALHDHYERLHEIYAQLDEPDGMEGITTLILSPSLEHQIRQHESTGHWTSAQSCWEVQLQSAPEELNSHLGLLGCLRNLGHYDTLRTHVEGVLTRRPDWEQELVGYQVQSACMIGNWGAVEALVSTTKAESSSVLMARVLLAMRSGRADAIARTLTEARQKLGAPVAAAGASGYRRSYEAVLELHLLHELQAIYNFSSNPARTDKRRRLQFEQRMSARIESTLPSFRVREPILSIRRIALGLRTVVNSDLTASIGQTWLLSAKLARKAGYWQTAYSAVLQSQQHKTPYSFMESSKLTRATGEPLRALQELENSISLSEKVIDLTDDSNSQRLRVKALLLRAKWMRDSDRFDYEHVLEEFRRAKECGKPWENALFHLGQFQDVCYKNLSTISLSDRVKLNMNTIRCFGDAIAHGDKYVYQMVPRLLTLWLDLGEEIVDPMDLDLKKATAFMSKFTLSVPTYKWYTAFPQIVSRIGHPSSAIWPVLQNLIITVIKAFPRQALWLFTSVVHAKNHTVRRDRGQAILEKVKSESERGTQACILASITMTKQLLELCNAPVSDGKKSLSMSKDFSSLAKLAPSVLIIPIQESLTASLPPTSTLQGTHQPFPVDAPTFKRFHDEIDIMRSLARPRKITIHGSNAQTYMFLGKPKDDLRKDARLMDFNAIINKLLKSNSESRRRQLRIRTYGIVTLNEECGFIQWVPNTIPVRPVLLKSYEALKIESWTGAMNATFQKIKETKDDSEAIKLFINDILSRFPLVFHEWFIETFPEPTAWLASRLAYSRTAAVMSMVGFILGLGDRHCENILLDTNTGDVVHVDFNCLFEKGKTLEIPERVPFRLTQNLVDGLGITGVEGVFRIACEVTMQLLRDNKDCLMSVLDAFIHDPLVEWEDEHRRMARRLPKKNKTGHDNNVAPSVDLKQLAKNALRPIEKKLKGIYSIGKEKSEKEISTSSLVQMLIAEATDIHNLAKMYHGWAAWH